MARDKGETNGAPGVWRTLFGGGKKTPQAKGLGTFVGVYTPTALTILGVIMYLRFGWVLSEVGLTKTLFIVLGANVITVITTLSFSAVATNTRVGVGGAYFIISRSLGLEIGGAIGLPLFLSQVFSVTLYAFGLAESLRIVWPDIPVQLTAFVIVAGVGALTFRGANLALRTQIPILAFIVISLGALLIGVLKGGMPGDFAVPAAGNVTFWAVFAVFFPAVTGVMAGLGLSGDLRDPGRSIPLGSLAAAGTGLLVYLCVPVLLALGTKPEFLSDPLVWTKIAPLGAWLILPGLWGAIFSSAVGSMLGAPRTLQALATDHLAPKPLAKVAGKQREPVVGLIVSLAIALGAVLLGDLNAVAVVVTMFFLTVYGTVNLVAALETMSGDTSWRPRIKVPWLVSLAGAFGCFAIMFLINPMAGVIALGVELLLWLWLQRKKHRADWGDARRDVFEALIRWALIRLSKRPVTARNWRPHVLLFTRSIERRVDLVRFAHWFSEGHGVLSVCELVTGDLLDDTIHPKERREQMQAVIDRQGLPGFAEVNVVRSVEEGIIDVAQANGLAGFESNTILLGWREASEKSGLAEFLRVMRRLEKLNKSLVIGRAQLWEYPREGQRRTVDIWWGGLQRNGDLMLLLAHLLTRSPAWRGCRIRILSVASNDHMKEETETFLAKLIPEIRIDAEVRVLLKPKERTIRDIIHEESANADVVFLGLATPAPGEEESYAERLHEMAEGLPSFFFVKNATLFVGDLLGSRPGTVGAALEKSEEPPKEEDE